MLSLNPITGTMDALGLIDTSQYADTCSGWYTAGQVTMGAVDLLSAGAVLNAATMEIGYSRYLFARGGGLLNSNNLLRLGWGWSAPAERVVFRLVVGNPNSTIHWHLDLL